MTSLKQAAQQALEALKKPKITLCPPGPEPQRFTASCAEMGKMLMGSPDGDLTIDQRRDLWSAYNRAPRSVTIEDWLAQQFGGEKK